MNEFHMGTMKIILKSAACGKDFAVYSGPKEVCHSFNAVF